MTSVLNYLQNKIIRIEQLGSRHLNKLTHPHFDIRFLLLTNLIAVLGAGISFFMSVGEFAEGQFFYGMSDLLGGLLMLLTLALNFAGFFNSARVFLLLILNLDIYYFNSISNFTAGLELLYLMFMLFPFFLYSAKEKFYLILTTAIPFVLFCINRFFKELNFIPQIYQQPAPSWYAIAVPVVSFSVTFVIIYRFLKISEEMQSKVIQRSKFSSLGEMAAGISHEINNPLSAVLLNVQLLKRDSQQTALPEQVTQRVEKIEQSAMRAARIIHGLERFSHDSADEPHVLVDLQKCIDETLQLCLQRFVSKGIDFRFKGKENVFLIGNSTQISEALVNLLNNAYDAVESVKEKWIEIEVREKTTQVEIRVTDSGSGVLLKHKEKIMQPFFTTKAVNKGTGLGLSVSKGIAESHHGDLFLDSEAPHTTFVLSMPRV